MSAAHLVEIKKEPSPDLIQMMEDLLAMAKGGQIISAACAFRYHDAGTGNAFCCNGYPVSLLGAMVVLQHEIVEISVGTRLNPSADD